MSVRIAAQFSGEARSMNGLDAIVEDLLEEPREKRYLIAEYHVGRKTEDVDDGSIVTPTIKLDHIEPIVITADAKTVQKLLQKAYLNRQKGEADAAGQADLFAGAEADEPPADVEETPAPAKRGRGRGNLFSAPDGEA